MTPDYQLKIGTARIDITPDYPIRLSGYGARKEETSEVIQPIWAKCLTISHQDPIPFVLVCVDNCGVPEHVTETVAKRLRTKAGIPREQFVLSVTHTHSAPFLSGALETLFGQPIPGDHQTRINYYTRELTDKLEQVAISAISHSESGTLSWCCGSIDFAGNRRTEGGPVDHDLPVLLAHHLNGELMAIWCSYACHTTTLSFNTINGDWAGYAMEKLEETYPTAVAMVSLGCAADANPYPRGEYAHAQQHGEVLADEVSRLILADPRPIHLDSQNEKGLVGQIKWIQLPFDTHPTRTEWEERLEKGGAIAYHARVQLDRLNRRKALQTTLSYAVQTWQFGSNLSVVFLAGEVVVDFALRLKRELNMDKNCRLWINAYCNDLPCYIPSVRILNEGGYEGKDSMIYFNRPTHFKPEIEELVIEAVHDLLP